MRRPLPLAPVVACLFLLACSGAEAPKAAPVPSDAWVTSVKPWYCGPEPLPALTGKDGAAQPQNREVAMKLVPGKSSFTAIYAAVNGTDKSVGSLTRFVSTGERTATMRWENDQRQNGDVVLSFAPDFATLTLTWKANKTPPGSSPVPGVTTTLTAAAGSSACVAGGMIR